MEEKRDSKKFPLTLKKDFNTVVDIAVLVTKTETKHQYIIDAVNEKLQRDALKHPQIALALAPVVENEVV